MLYVALYLLAGFVMYFIGTAIMGRRIGEWRWELVAILLWPLTMVLAVAIEAKQASQKQP